MAEKSIQDGEARQRRNAQRLQLLLWQLDVWMQDEDPQGMWISHITLKSGRTRGGEHLVIVKAQFEGVPYVGFHSAEEAESALRGALDRLRNNTLKWKQDEPYTPGE